MTGFNETIHFEIHPDAAALPAGAALRAIPPQDGWEGLLSGSMPLGFAARRLTAWTHLEGLEDASNGEEPAPEAVVQARVSPNGSKWSDWLRLAWYGAPEQIVGGAPVLPAAWRAGLASPPLRVLTDEINAEDSASFRFVQMRVLLRGGARLAGLGATAIRPGAHESSQKLDYAALPDAPILRPVPHIAQFDVPEIGGHICSPVSVLMTARAFGVAGAAWTPEVACRRVLDHQVDIWGNWSRATQLGWEAGLRVTLEYYGGLAEPIEHLRAGRLIVASVKYAAGELTGAPRPQSGGHLVLIAGYDAARRRFLSFDSAAPADAALPLTYDAAEFARIWLDRAALGYVVEPR